ncbi:cyclic nucleotide-binding domain-containing protein [Dactylosporangium vinaceum]|uniref:Crp/Fnr family transcriptional regulator n=1 Tax=Dactylosporangium vinaceum TaxID=53362 RepID=A0ABV5MKR6_9ACTN|nr:cyclic nucleotide-binding domain-containing protein [Dactylosporangium vinaceum]UAB93924.1 cyclic nucleotide-binding domain-containing protein [Dactylosporangium vinaceum]
MSSTYDLMVAHPFLTGLPPAYVERLSHWARRVPLPAGTRVFEEHGRADRWWLIRDGYVNLDTRLPGRGDVIVETLGPGSVQGWSWLFPPYRWHFGAVTLGPVLAIALAGPGVRGLCDADPAFGYELTRRFTAVVVDRMQATRMRLLDLYREPA